MIVKQFYKETAPSDSINVIQFDAPVRKMLVTSSRAIFVLIPFANNIYSAPFYIPANNVVNIDLQSANAGKGCVSIGLKSTAPDLSASVYLSIVEYGSDGDNEWYK